MVRKLILALFLCFTASLCSAQITKDAIPMTGVIIDARSADNHKDDLPGFIQTYTKDDALLPEAIAGGYAIFIGDGYMKFDQESSGKVMEFLDNTSSALEVAITASIGEDDILNLVTIENK